MAKVLVVDDQRNMRTTLSLMLRDAGHEVVEAHDGDHACDLVGADSFDLVLTDLQDGRDRRHRRCCVTPRRARR